MQNFAKIVHKELLGDQGYKLQKSLGSSSSKVTLATETLADFINDFEINKKGNNNGESSAFNRAYAMYIASEKILDSTRESPYIQVENNISFNTDKDVLYSTSNNWTSTVIKNSGSSLEEVAHAYFSQVKDESFQEMRKHGNPRKYVEFDYQPAKSVNFDDIIGNEKAKKEVIHAVRSLFSYDPSTKKNPFQKVEQLNSKLLLVGEPGGGKSMLAKYAIDFGKELAEKHNKTLYDGELHFNSQNQDGPIIELKKQLNKITQGNDIHIIFMDEAEDKFPRSTHNQEHKSDTVNEFKKFLEGNSYQNRGNYLFIAATNEQSKMNEAILSRFKTSTYQCKGPISAKEKEAVFRVNLEKRIDEKYCSFDWDEVSELFSKYELSGRHLRDAARAIANKSNGMKQMKGDYPDEYYELNFEDQIKYIKGQTKTVTLDDIVWGIKEGYSDER